MILVEVRMTSALIGALLGDAIGAPIEFYYNKEITEQDITHCLELKGQGIFKLGEGQITDDGEMTLSLIRSLYTCKDLDNHSVVATTILEGYSDWLKSGPFDKGNTCSMAIISYCRYSFPKCLNFLNKESQANGALMRATAIPVFCIKNQLSLNKALELSIIDSQITHPHEVCKDTALIYTYSLYHLLKGTSPDDTLNRTTKFVDKHINSIVKTWYCESISIETLDFRKNIGHVKWAFIAAYYFLRNTNFTYIQAMEIVLKKGGDTDTNCCIVGGMVACYQPIPEYMINKLLQFDCTQQGNKRPIDYSVKSTFLELCFLTN